MWSSMFSPDRPKVTRRVDVRRILAFFRPYWLQEALVLACIFVVSLIGLLPPLLTRWLIDGAIPAHDMRGVWLAVGGMIASALVGGVIGVYQGYLNSLVGEGIMRDIRTSLVSHLHRMPLSFFTNTKTGEIMNRVSTDVDNIDNVVTGTLVSIVTNVATMVTTVVTIFILDWRLALVALAVIPLMILPLSPVGPQDVRRAQADPREARRDRERSRRRRFRSPGSRSSSRSCASRSRRTRFYKAGTELMTLEIRLAMVGRWFIAAIIAMVVIGPALVWIGGAWLAIHGGLTIGTIVAFVAYFGRLYTPASSLAGVQVQIVSALAVFERIFDYLDMPVEGGQKPDAQQCCRRVRGEGRLRRRALLVSARARRARRGDASVSRPDRWPRSSAPRAPARPRSPNWFRASTIRSRARC